MRVAFFSECYLPVTNGVVTSMTTLRDSLRALGHEVFVFAPGAPQPGEDDTIFRLPELPFPRHPYHFARPFPRLPAEFDRLGVQVVHCHHPFTVGRLGALTARKHGLPMVYTAHTLYDTMAAHARSPLARSVGQPAARGVVKRFCARAEYVIVPSRITREALRADGVRARFAVVPSSVPVPAASPQGRERLRADLGLSAEAPLLLCVGRLGPEKRVDLLLRVAANLKARGLGLGPSAFRLALVGDGQCRSALEAMAEEYGVADVTLFAGAQPRASIGDWYAAADLFLLSSPAETQGLVLVEAMAAGLPCVAVDYGGPRETVVHGETGLRVRFDANSFAGAVANLIADPERRAAMAQRALARAASYTPGSMALAVVGVYEAAIRSSSHHGGTSGFVRRTVRRVKG